MTKKFLTAIITLSLIGAPSFICAEELVENTIPSSGDQYTIGADDILEISVIQPDQIVSVVTVSPDGSIAFPYVGNIVAKDKTPEQVRQEIERALSDGYMKYPVVSVSLKESRSRKFSVYGEVIRPGTYTMEENTSVLRAISTAGGFNKFGSSSRVKLLRSKASGDGYDTIKVNIKAVMKGDPQSDFKLQPGDIVVVSEGIF